MNAPHPSKVPRHHTSTVPLSSRLGLVPTVRLQRQPKQRQQPTSRYPLITHTPKKTKTQKYNPLANHQMSRCILPIYSLASYENKSARIPPKEKKKQIWENSKHPPPTAPVQLKQENKRRTPVATCAERNL